MSLKSLTNSLISAVSSAQRMGVGETLADFNAAIGAERDRAHGVVRFVQSMPARAAAGPFAAADPGPPPEMPDPQAVLDQARRNAVKIGTITAGVVAWKEAFDLYGAYRRGQPLTRFVVWSATKRVGGRAFAAASYAGRRHLTVVTLDSAARVIAWQAARRASKSGFARAVHVVARRFAGRASIAVAGVEIFMVMHKDIKRFRSGDLQPQDFYRNCALTGVSIAAPLAGGALGGPIGATVGTVVAVGAGMYRK